MVVIRYFIIFCFFCVCTPSFAQKQPYIIYDVQGIKTRSIDLIKNFIKDWLLKEIEEEVDEEKLEVFLDNILEQYQEEHLSNFSLQSIKDLLLSQSGNFELVKDIQGFDFTGYTKFPTNIIQNTYLEDGNKFYQAKSVYESISFTEGNIPKTIEDVAKFKSERNIALLGFDEYSKKRKIETAILYKELAIDLVNKANQFLKEVKTDGKEGMRMSEAERVKAINLCYKMIGDAYSIIEYSDNILNEKAKLHPIWESLAQQYEWKLMRQQLSNNEP